MTNPVLDLKALEIPLGETQSLGQKEYKSAGKKEGRRDERFDFLKGFLVLVMVAHHSIEYFVARDHPFLKYLDFVTGGFVFASGFLAALLSSGGQNGRGTKDFKKHLFRGARLLLLFLLVNILLACVVSLGPQWKSFGLWQFFGNLDIILFQGQKAFAAFGILVPISYTLMAFGLLRLIPGTRIVAASTAIMLLIYCTWDPDVAYNVYYLTVGISGISLGLSIAPSVISHARTKLPIIAFSCGIVLYMSVISMVQSDGVLVYLGGIVCVLGAVYSSAALCKPGSLLFRYSVLLGRYSLVAYITHLFLFQILRRLAFAPIFRLGLGLIPFIVGVTFLIILASSLEVLRWRFNRVNVWYRAVFG